MKADAYKLLRHLIAFLFALCTASIIQAQTYCTNNLYVGGCTAAYINSFATSGATLNIANNNTGCGGSGGYSNYTSLTINAYRGATVNFTIANNPSVDCGYAMWIDWNNNGSFLDANEQIFAVNPSIMTAGKTYINSFTVPANATAGIRRLRIRCIANTTVLAAGPCGLDFNGEVEDYSIRVLAPTITTGGIVGNAFCQGFDISVPFVADGFFSTSNIFTAQLSDATGSFSTIRILGTLNGTESGTIAGQIPETTPPGNNYRVRVISSSPSATGSNSPSVLLIQPSSACVLATWYLDADGDGYYSRTTESATSPGPGWSQHPGLGGGDCDDNNPNIPRSEASIELEVSNPLHRGCNEGSIQFTYITANCASSYTAELYRAAINPGTQIRTHTGTPGEGPITFSALNELHTSDGAPDFILRIFDDKGAEQIREINMDVPCDENGSYRVTGYTPSSDIGCADGAIEVTYSTTDCFTKWHADLFKLEGGETIHVGTEESNTNVIRFNNVIDGYYIIHAQSNAGSFLMQSCSKQISFILPFNRDFERCSFDLEVTPGYTTSACTSGKIKGKITHYWISSDPICAQFFKIDLINSQGNIVQTQNKVITYTPLPLFGLDLFFEFEGIPFGTYEVRAIPMVQTTLFTNKIATLQTICGANYKTINLQAPSTIPEPGPITGPISAVCPGSFHQYSIAQQNLPPDVSIIWGPAFENPNLFIIGENGTNTVNIGFIAGFEGGSLGVAYINNQGCDIPPKGSVLPIFSKPNEIISISGPSVACKNTTQTYSVESNIQNGTTFIWSLPQNATIQSQSGQGNSTVAIRFNAQFKGGTLSVVASNNCGTSSRIERKITAAPDQPEKIYGPVSVCKQSFYTYSIDPVPTATSYEWKLTGGAKVISGDGTPSVCIEFKNNGGDVKVRAVNSCGEGDYQVLTVFSVDCTGPNSCAPGSIAAKSQPVKATNIEENNSGEPDISVAPNPANNYFTLLLKQGFTGKIEVRIFDMAGRGVETISRYYREALQFGENLKPGIYFAEIIQGDKKKTIRLLKQ